MRCKLFIFLALILLLGLIPVFTYNTYSIEASIAEEVREKIEAGNDEVEVLIYMKEQADLTSLAQETKQILPEDAELQTVKLKKRKQVVDYLLKKATISQNSIIKKLEAEMNAGRVFEYESFYVVNMIYARVAPTLVEDLARRNDVEYIYDNKILELEVPPAEELLAPLSNEFIPWNIARIKAPGVWSEEGLDGSGVVIAIIDTGVNYKHPALEQNWRGYDPNDPSYDYNWFDPIYGRSEPDDVNGHGTKVAGIAVGYDHENEKHIGTAPGATWITVRGINDNGRTTKANLIKAGEFVLAPTDRKGDNPIPELAPDIVVNAWGAKWDVDDWYMEMVDNWRMAYIFPVFAAGNSGPDDETINNPGNYPSSFAVGAIDDQDKLASFSSRGPGAYGDFIKPELVAPGVNIYTSTPEGYSTSSGTSLAAPHVAGVAALMLEGNPALELTKLEDIIKKSAIAISDENYPGSPNYGYGYGLINAEEAVAMAINCMVLKIEISGQGDVVPMPGKHYFQPDAEVVVTAEARVGWVFEGWIIDESVKLEDKSITLSMNQNRTVKALFVEDQRYKEWVILDEPHEAVSLEEEWLVTFTRSFETEEIDGMVIEKDEKVISVDVELLPDDNQAMVKPVVPYLPDETYTLLIYLKNLNRYIMYFNTVEVEE